MLRNLFLIAFFFITSLQVQAQKISFKKILKAGEKAARNVGRTVEKGVQDLNKTTGIAIHDIGKATGKAAEDSKKTIEKGLTDASRESGRAGKNIVAETGRVGNNTVDLFKALEKFTEKNIDGTMDLAKSTEQRIREGKLLDAVFHVALDPLTTQEEAAFLATQQSGYLNTAGAVAAGVYGGPGGSAAYAAWQTYRISGGNAELALRAGIITGLSSAALKGIGEIDATTKIEILEKAVLAGSVGGLAIAASGGDEQQIKDGFILGGGMVLVQDIYKDYTKQPFDASPATKEPYCTSPLDKESCAILKTAYYKDENGKQVFDPSKLDRNASHVGTGANPAAPLELGQKIPWTSDQSVLMRSAAKVPGMNAMGLFHDKLVVSWAISETIGNQLTIYPAMLFTYLGTDGGLTAKIAEVNAGNDTSKTQSKKAEEITNTTTVEQPDNIASVFTDSQGRKFTMIDNTVFNSWGQKIEIQNLPNEIAVQITNSQQFTPPATVMFDFSSPGTKLDQNSADIPCGFNGVPDTYKPLPSLEFGRKYIDNENWEDYGMEKMLTSKHKSAPIGSVIYARNIENGALVKTYVIGKLSEPEINSGATIVLSDPARKQLGVNGDSFWVETDYEDIGVETLTFKVGGHQKIAFDNLRNGKWTLRIFDNFKTLYTIKDYQNTLEINLPGGQYGFDLVDDSPLQTYRVYTGTLVVNQ